MKESGQNGKRWKQNKRENLEPKITQGGREGEVHPFGKEGKRVSPTPNYALQKSADANLLGETREEAVEWKKQKAGNFNRPGFFV